MYATKFFPTIIMPISSSHFLPFLNPNLSSLGIFRFIHIHPKKKKNSLFTFNPLPSMSFSTSPLLIPYSSQYLPTNLMHPNLLIQIQINHSPLLAIISLPVWPLLTYTSSFPSSAIPSYQPTSSGTQIFRLCLPPCYTYLLLPIFFPKCFTLGWQLLRHLRRLKWPVTCTFYKFFPFLSPLLNSSIWFKRKTKSVTFAFSCHPSSCKSVRTSFSYLPPILLPKCFHLALTTCSLDSGGCRRHGDERLLHLKLSPESVRQISFPNSLLFLFPGSSLIRFTFSPVLGGVRRLISSSPSC